jgi:hypothetical protein
MIKKDLKPQEKTLLDEIHKELQQIKKLLAVFYVKELEQKKQIQSLKSIGFQPKEIAELIGTTANNVRVGLNRSNRQNKRFDHPVTA